jgi:hypothetical protein
VACTRGCCATQKEHYRSIRIANVDRKQMTKTTVDDHGTHKVEVKEHFSDRQDVTVKVPTVALTTTQNEVY